MKVDTSPVVCEPIRDVHSNSIAPIGEQCWARNTLINRKHYSFYAVRCCGYVRDLEPILPRNPCVRYDVLVVRTDILRGDFSLYGTM